MQAWIFPFIGIKIEFLLVVLLAVQSTLSKQLMFESSETVYGKFTDSIPTHTH